MSEEATTPKSLPDLVDAPVIVMLMTMIGTQHSSRPLTCVEVEGDRLSFLVDRSSEWATAVSAGSATVHATISDDRHNTYLAMNGAADIVADRSEVDRLWNPAASAYFEQDDPNVAVLRFDVSDGEYWDGPSGRLGSVVALLRARLAGDDEDPGRKSGDQGPIATST